MLERELSGTLVVSNNLTADPAFLHAIDLLRSVENSELDQIANSNLHSFQLAVPADQAHGRRLPLHADDYPLPNQNHQGSH